MQRELRSFVRNEFVDPGYSSDPLGYGLSHLGLLRQRAMNERLDGMADLKDPGSDTRRGRLFVDTRPSPMLAHFGT